jgi:hypothetical protein
MIAEQKSMFEITPGRPSSLRTVDPGKAARDEGIRRVAVNAGEWRERASEMIEGLARRLPDFTADEVREEAERVGLGEPHHFNAWGAVMMAAARRGLIRKTMTVRPSQRKEAHGHCNPVWRSLVFGGDSK